MPHWFHWATQGGYNFVSGPLADITLVTSFIAAVVLYWRHHNCHVQGCWRLQWHPHPGHGHPVCSVHHPYGQGRGEHLASYHHTDADHEKWNAVPPASGFARTATAMTWSGTVEGPVEVVVAGGGLPEPDPRLVSYGEFPGHDQPPPRRRRIRRPGTPDVTPIRKDSA